MLSKTGTAESTTELKINNKKKMAQWILKRLNVRPNLNPLES